MGRRVTRGLLGMALALGAALATGSPVAGQEDEVHAAIFQIFDGMRAADPDRVRDVLAEGMQFAVSDEMGTIGYMAPDGWLNAMAGSGGAWDEQIYDVEIRVDGTMASAWVPYTFYLNGEISHCGINSIEFRRDPEGWKATYLTDTRRQQNCPDPHGG